MNRVELVLYFCSFARNYRVSQVHEVLQGGISVIRYPADYSTDTLQYWYTLCKQLGY